MKKVILLTLLDGRKIERSLDADAKDLPIGTPASDPSYLAIIQFFAMHGIPDEVKKDYVRVIPPSQIATIEIIFSNPLTKV